MYRYNVLVVLLSKQIKIEALSDAFSSEGNRHCEGAANTKEKPMAFFLVMELSEQLNPKP